MTYTQKSPDNLTLIDVTLRDGGHQVNFDWPIEYSKKHISELSKVNKIKYIELGYWKQTAKSRNPHYQMDERILSKLSSEQDQFKKFSLMVDCHYCSHNQNDYPSKEEFGVGLFRVCSRSEDIDRATRLGEMIKNRTGCKLSMNFFNITNYSDNELKQCIQKASDAGADYIYFADSHGTLDLLDEFDKYSMLAEMISNKNITPGLHLHDHSGKAYLNYRILPKAGFGATDVSLSGIGKGSGNLKLEYVIKPLDAPAIYDLLVNNTKLLTNKSSIFELISSSYSITDYYALEARSRNILPSQFIKLAKTIKGKNKDNYKKGIL